MEDGYRYDIESVRMPQERITHVYQQGDVVGPYDIALVREAIKKKRPKIETMSLSPFFGPTPPPGDRDNPKSVIFRPYYLILMLWMTFGKVKAS